MQSRNNMGFAAVPFVVVAIILFLVYNHSPKGGPNPLAGLTAGHSSGSVHPRNLGTPKTDGSYVYTPDCGQLNTPSVLGNVRVIVAVASADHVSAQTAVADSIHESCVSNTSVGDNGCSIGLFQLNACGGEGNGMSVGEREDPWTNAETALTRFRAEEGSTSDPGWQAAEAENPADKPGYAADVDSLLGPAATLIRDAGG